MKPPSWGAPPAAVGRGYPNRTSNRPKPSVGSASNALCPLTHGRREALSRVPPNRLRILQRATLDEMSDRIEIHGGDIASQAKRLKWDCAAACEAIKDLGRSVRVRISNQLLDLTDGTLIGRPLKG